jgi:hypothetical protein
VDFNQRVDIIAFYSEAVGTLPQLPTTCFSLSPAVLPMWAHYAQNSQGFVVEFDEEKLTSAFPESNFDDVDYRDVPHEALTEMLYRASEIGKPRYVYLLQNWVFKSAYFTKNTCWSYERERRMVVSEQEIRKADEMLLLDVPTECIKSLIVGPRANDETTAALRVKADELGCHYFQLRVGKSSASPFLVDEGDVPYQFDGSSIEPSSQYCNSCLEPLVYSSELCSWCQIEESHMQAAASRNPYRLYHNMGLLDAYVESMDNISRSFRKKQS